MNIKSKKVLLVAMFLILASIMGIVLAIDMSRQDNQTTIDPHTQECEEKYAQAIQLIGECKYQEAYEILVSLGDFKDAAAQLDSFRYVMVKSKRANGMPPALPYKEVILNEYGLPSVIKIFDSGYVNGKMDTNEYAYDINGNLIKELANFADGRQDVFDYVYDENNNVIEASYSSRNGTPYTELYTYDSSNNLVNTVRTDINGFTVTTNYNYDENGRPVKVTTSSATDYSTVSEYTYDENGNLLTESVQYTIDSASDLGYSTYVENKYDSEGKLIEITEYRDGEEESKITLTYDENGNIIKKVNSVSGITDMYEYAFVYIPFGVSKKVDDLLDSLICN